MASRRCLLRLLSSRLVPQRSQPLAPVSIATRTLSSLSEPRAQPAARALASSRLYYPSRCHFATRSSGDEEDDDEGEHYDDEGSEREWGEEDEAVAAKKPSGKTEEEKLSEAAEIGYKVVGPLEAEEKPFKPYEPVFAVVQIGSHQFKVSNGDSIFTERLKFCDVNDKLVLNRVLMLGSQTQTVIGRPLLPEAAVHAVVEEHALDAKVIIFKKKRRKNYRRTKGHRQELTKLRITNIEGIDRPETVAVAA
ncbi:50S ribosomal protein L21, mitochondrial [Dichanthelium oligosanthes]|uniref:Large ribosomal subunit protein bL21m n=1 Tax=Dichanthelium oligosanthes TaxID=888268 RepID=A0A1E5VUM2_9POAL|nr:50S ribosomal protein L21, mitochondrial [Dichanthelium oligosanthes]